MRPVGSKTRGAALILVLMVVGILGLLALQMGLNAKANVSRAERLQQRTEAMLRLQSNEAALVFTLLTEPWVTGRERDTDNPYAKVWNFRGEPFEVDGIRYAIQDIKGLLSVPQAGDPIQTFQILLENLGVERSRARRVIERLSDAQGSSLQSNPQGDRRVPWQSLDEWRGLTELTDKELARLDSLVSLYPNAEFNPATAPPAVLATKYDEGTLEPLLSLQQRDEFDADRYRRLTGFGEDEFTVFYPGPGLRLSTSSFGDGFSLGRESTLILRPYEFEPVQMWGRKRLFNTADLSP